MPECGGLRPTRWSRVLAEKKDAQDTGNLLLLAREMPVGAAPGPQGLGKMLCEVLKHILDCWAYINQQERSHKPRAAAQGPTATGSSAGAPDRGEERVTRRMVFAHLECCVRFPGQCRCQQPPGERAPRLRDSIPFPKYGYFFFFGRKQSSGFKAPSSRAAALSTVMFPLSCPTFGAPPCPRKPGRVSVGAAGLGGTCRQMSVSPLCQQPGGSLPSPGDSTRSSLHFFFQADLAWVGIQRQFLDPGRSGVLECGVTPLQHPKSPPGSAQLLPPTTLFTLCC